MSLVFLNVSLNRVDKAMNTKLGARRSRKATDGQSPKRRPALRNAAKGSNRKAANPVPAKARPPYIGGRAPVLRLRPNGNIHESANCSPSRHELQSNIADRCPNHSGAHGSCALGLASGGRAIRKANPSATPKILSIISIKCPNISLNRKAPAGCACALVSFVATGFSGYLKRYAAQPT